MDKELIDDYCTRGGCEGLSNDCWKTCPDSIYNFKNKKAIEDMATDLDDCLVWISGDCGDEIETEETAENLIRAGYGNIKQAFTAFAEKLKNAFVKAAVDSVSRIDLIENFGNAFDETLKEFLEDD